MIDKTKAYRFKGDSERWTHECDWWWCGDLAISKYTAEHLHSRGVLIEYPELPGEDWEFCEGESAERFWSDVTGRWRDYGLLDGATIYCRKKKPVITEVEIVVESHWAAGDRIYLPAGFAGPGDRVKVTKL